MAGGGGHEGDPSEACEGRRLDSSGAASGPGEGSGGPWTARWLPVVAPETKELIDKMFNSSIDKMFAALIGNKQLSEKEIKKLKDLIKDLEAR